METGNVPLPALRPARPPLPSIAGVRPQLSLCGEAVFSRVISTCISPTDRRVQSAEKTVRGEVTGGSACYGGFVYSTVSGHPLLERICRIVRLTRASPGVPPEFVSNLQRRWEGWEFGDNLQKIRPVSQAVAPVRCTRCTLAPWGSPMMADIPIVVSKTGTTIRPPSSAVLARVSAKSTT